MATIPRLAEFAPQHFARFYLANCMQVRALLSFAVRICFVSIPCESYRNFQWEIMGRIETRPRKKCWSDYQIWKGWYSDEVRRGGREIHNGNTEILNHDLTSAELNVNGNINFQSSGAGS